MDKDDFSFVPIDKTIAIMDKDGRLLFAALPQTIIDTFAELEQRKLLQEKLLQEKEICQA